MSLILSNVLWIFIFISVNFIRRDGKYKETKRKQQEGKDQKKPTKVRISR
jgi:hypothetical protein